LRHWRTNGIAVGAIDLTCVGAIRLTRVGAIGLTLVSANSSRTNQAQDRTDKDHLRTDYRK
jgi:hypothetical protein